MYIPIYQPTPLWCTLSSVSCAGTGPELSDKSKFRLVRLNSMPVVHFQVTPHFLHTTSATSTLIRVASFLMCPVSCCVSHCAFVPLLLFCQFSRTVSPDTLKGPAFAALMTHHKWTSTVMLADSSEIHLRTSVVVTRTLEGEGIKVVSLPPFDRGKFTGYWTIRKSGIRVIIIMAYE